MVRFLDKRGFAVASRAAEHGRPGAARRRESESGSHRRPLTSFFTGLNNGPGNGGSEIGRFASSHPRHRRTSQAGRSPPSYRTVRHTRPAPRRLTSTVLGADLPCRKRREATKLTGRWASRCCPPAMWIYTIAGRSQKRISQKRRLAPSSARQVQRAQRAATLEKNQNRYRACKGKVALTHTRDTDGQDCRSATACPQSRFPTLGKVAAATA